jgi:hypothetical protein
MEFTRRFCRRFLLRSFISCIVVWKACRGFVPALTVPAAATSRRTFPRGIAPSPLCHTDSAHVPHLSASRAVFDEENPSLEEALDRTAFVFESLTVEETQKRLVTEGVQYSETAANSSLLANQAPSMQTRRFESLLSRGFRDVSPMSIYVQFCVLFTTRIASNWKGTPMHC